MKDSGGILFCIPWQTTFPFLCKILYHCLFTALHCPLLCSLSCWDSSHSGQGGTLTDRQSWYLFGLFCCSRDICSNTWPFLAVQPKKLFLFIIIIFKKKNEFQESIPHHILYCLRPNYSCTTNTLSVVSLSKYTTSRSKFAARYHVIEYFKSEVPDAQSNLSLFLYLLKVE